MDICRYVSAQRFSEMVMSSKLSLISPVKWNDRYENYLLQILERPSEKQQFVKKLSFQNGFSEDQANEIIDFSKLISSCARCLCFSRSIDAEVMWNAYNFDNKTIMWKTTDRKIEGINKEFEIKLVKYDLEDLGYMGFARLFSNVGDSIGLTNAHELFTHKRKAFSYENELRVIDFVSKKNAPELVDYPIPNISEFIDGVLVHPLAQDWYINVIELICRNYQIPFLGKSEIYQLSSVY